MLKALQNKTEVNLVTIGTGVIFFGVWTFLKVTLSYFLIDSASGQNIQGIVYALATVIFCLFAVFLALIHCYIGFSARAEGNGKKKSPAYLIVTGILCFLNFIIILLEAVVAFNSRFTFNMIINIIIDITLIVFLIELMVNSIRIRRIRKQSAKEAGYER